MTPSKEISKIALAVTDNYEYISKLSYEISLAVRCENRFCLHKRVN